MVSSLSGPPDDPAATPANGVDRSDLEIGRTVVERLDTPVWLFDIDRARVVWANPSGLRLWRAESLEDLVARDMSADMSASVRARLEQYRADFERNDARFSEVWTLYPGGVPTTLRVIFSGRRLDDGRMGMLCEALAEINDTPERLRSAEALLHTPVMIPLYDPRGRALYRNPASRQARARGDEAFRDRFVDPERHRPDAGPGDHRPGPPLARDLGAPLPRRGERPARAAGQRDRRHRPQGGRGAGALSRRARHADRPAQPLGDRAGDRPAARRGRP